MNALKVFTFYYKIGYNCGIYQVEKYLSILFNSQYGLQLVLVTNNALDNGKL